MTNLIRVLTILVGVFCLYEAYESYRLVGKYQYEQMSTVPMAPQSKRIERPSCVKNNSCSQDLLIDYTYILVADKIDEANDKSTIFLILAFLSFLPISQWIYDSVKRKKL